MSLHDDPNGFRTTATADAYIARWKSASQEQGAVFSEVLAKSIELEAKNLELEHRIKALEYENWTIHKMLEKGRAETKLQEAQKQSLKTRVDVLTSEQESFKNECAMIVCLLDGDGCIFSQDYLRRGAEGGFAAAQRLSAGIQEHLRKSPERTPPGARLLVMVYLSMIGIESALIGNGVCTHEQFAGFFAGFGAAHPLISVIDCGTGKEAADHKIRDNLDLFIRLPQTFKIFFGGGHDNGYHGTLAATHTIGLKEKIILLQSYAQLGREIGSLNLPALELPDLFMVQKLERRPLLKKIPLHTASFPAYPTPQDTPSSKKTGSNNAAKASRAAKKRSKSMTSAPVPPPPQEVKPRTSEEILIGDHSKGEYHLPCLHHHLNDAGCEASNCPFDHESALTPAQLQSLKDMSSLIPCRYIKNNRPCHLKECHFGHSCPHGATCEAYRRNKCPFTGLGMHD